MSEINELILEEHRKMLIFSGNVSDFQLKNISGWAKIVIPSFKEVKIQYNFKTGAGKIVYKFTLDKPVNNDLKDKALIHLNEWAKAFFFADTTVSIFFNEKQWKLNKKEKSLPKKKGKLSKNSSRTVAKA